MQWNASSLTAHGAELKHFLSNCKYLPDVICVQETFLKENKVGNLDCYDIVRRDRVGTAGGGVATFIKTGLNYMVLDNPAGIECIIIEVAKSYKMKINVKKTKNYAVVSRTRGEDG